MEAHRLLAERVRQPLRHAREPGIEGEQLEPLPERPAAIIVVQRLKLSATFPDPCSTLYLAINRSSMVRLNPRGLARGSEALPRMSVG